jgi:ABC-2 type transport system permease protein
VTTPSQPTGAIYDIGYQHYEGKRLGRRGAVRALYYEGLRSVFGIGRGGRAKIPPVALLAMMIIPAMVQSAVEGFAGGLVQIFTISGPPCGFLDSSALFKPLNW